MRVNSTLTGEVAVAKCNLNDLHKIAFATEGTGASQDGILNYPAKEGEQPVQKTVTFWTRTPPTKTNYVFLNLDGVWMWIKSSTLSEAIQNKTKLSEFTVSAAASRSRLTDEERASRLAEREAKKVQREQEKAERQAKRETSIAERKAAAEAKKAEKEASRETAAAEKAAKRAAEIEAIKAKRDALEAEAAASPEAKPAPTGKLKKRPEASA